MLHRVTAYRNKTDVCKKINLLGSVPAMPFNACQGADATRRTVDGSDAVFETIQRYGRGIELAIGPHVCGGMSGIFGVRCICGGVGAICA